MIFAVLGILVLLMSCEPLALGSWQGGHLQEATGKIEEWRVDDSTTVTQPARAWHPDLQPQSLSTSAGPSLSC